MRELSLNIMDIAQNSIAAGATRIRIAVERETGAETLSITVEDNGRGMTPEQVEQVRSPFYTTRTTRPVGLGIPLFRMAAEQTGGQLAIRSKEGEGTVVRAEFHTGHIDMTPLGDVAETILLLVSCNPSLDFIYHAARDGRSFTLDTREMRDILGEEVSLGNPDVVAWLREYLSEGEQSLVAEENP